MMRFVSLLLVGVAMFSQLFLSAPVVQACSCFCGVEGIGAQPIGDMGVSDCSSACADSGKVMIVCADSAAQYPSQGAKCFTEESCTNNGGDFDSYQPAECIPGQHYCYARGEPAQLSVSIGGVSSVQDYGAYINLAYNYLLSISVFITIVFVMIGGLQYVLAAGSGETAKAKERIRNAVIGLVLLLFANVILRTVNPRLIQLDVPSFPMVKRIEYIGGQSCEYLQGTFNIDGRQVAYGPPFAATTSPHTQAPYTIENPSNGEVCGSVGEVTRDGTGNSVAEGTTCQYEYCEEGGCVGMGEESQCVTCVELLPSEFPGLSVSDELCNALARPATFNGDGSLATQGYCFATHDPAVLVSGWTAAAYAGAPITGGLSIAAITALGFPQEEASAIYNGACAQVDIDCQQVADCESYAEVTVTTGISDNELGDLYMTESVNLQSVCTADPCGAAKKAGGTRCVYSDAGTLDIEGADCTTE